MSNIFKNACTHFLFSSLLITIITIVLSNNLHAYEIKTSVATSSENTKERITSKIFSNEILEIEDLWARPTMGINKNTAIYLKITNKSGQKELILKSASAPELTSIVELHDSFIDENGVSRMKSVDSLVIPQNSSIELKPGGTHIMALKLNRKLEVGNVFHINLVFSQETIKNLQTIVK